MPTELALHIGRRKRYRDGDILRVTFAYDAQRLVAETISNGRHGAVRDANHVTRLKKMYLSITNPISRPQPAANALATWWALCESLTGLRRNDYANFPYSSRERQLMLIVPLDREATQNERSQWMGRGSALRVLQGRTVPMRVNWVVDVLNSTRVRTGRNDEGQATAADVRDERRQIHVLDPISANVIQMRA